MMAQWAETVRHEDCIMATQHIVVTEQNKEISHTQYEAMV
jgi:hypothetical protein